MTRLIIREAAYADLERIHATIAADRPGVADSTISRILDAFERLTTFPSMGRKGTVPETREWVINGTPYVVVYRPEPSMGLLTIVAVFHGAQDR
jgi:toxin ParE1/3/4